MTVERPLCLAGIDPNRVYKTAEIKALKESGERGKHAPPVIRKIHKRGTAADPLRGLFETTLNGAAAVVEYEADPDRRDTEQIPLQEAGGIDAFLRREVLPYAPDALVPARQRQDRLRDQLHALLLQAAADAHAGGNPSGHPGAGKGDGRVAWGNSRRGKAMIAELKPYVEMKDSGVPWLGEVPVHWEVKRSKSLLSRNDSGLWGSDFDDDGVIVLRSTEQTQNGEWNISAPARRRFTTSEYLACRLEEGDLVVTKSSGSALHIGKTSIVTQAVAVLDCCFSNFMQRLRVKQNMMPRFVWYALNGELGRRQFDYYSDTTTGLANLNGEVIGRVTLAHPPLSEQIAIVRFLDHANRRIRRYICAKQKLIALLEEQKQAIIHQAVTGQVDVRTDQPYPVYKPSGVEWLGEVPAHWERRAVWQLFQIGRGKVVSHEYIADHPGPFPLYSSQTENDGVMGHIDTFHVRRGLSDVDDRWGTRRHRISSKREVQLHQCMRDAVPEDPAKPGLYAHGCGIRDEAPSATRH